MSDEFSDLDELDSPRFGFHPRNIPLPALLMSIVGIIFVGLGGYLFVPDLINDKPQGIQVLETDTQSDKRHIFVEIAGAVKSPGVYEIEQDKRVNDVINLSGGFTQDADMEWVENVLNRAAYVTDGQKIVIPAHDQQTVAGSATEIEDYQTASADRGSGSSQMININTASLSELESLWGIGPVIGQNIIDQRPYSSVEELLSKKIIKSNVYERNKDLMSVY